MYSIMIVDDEEAIHQAIKVIGDWKKYQVTQILDAYNGQEALDLLHENLVDLVFLDIKMPKIGGLEFIERLKKLTLSPRVIIISGYNDFEYLQFAIRAGIEDYLLKPINRHEFGETMERTMENLKKDRLIRTQVELDKITSEPLLTECFLKQLIYSRGDLLKEREKFDEYIVHQEDNCCRVVQIYISNFDKIAQFMFEGDSYSAYKAMCDTVNKESDSIKKICSFRDDMQWNTIIAVIIYEKRKFTGKLNHNFLRVSKCLKEKFQAEVIIGISATYSKENTIQKCYKNVKDFLFRVNIMNSSHKVFMVETEQINDAFKVFPVDRATLLSSFQTKNVDIIDKMIEDYFIKVEQEKFYSHKLAGKIIFEWITALEYIQVYLNVDFMDLQYDTIMYELVKAGYILDVVKDILKKAVNRQMNQYINMQKNNEEIPKIIKEYIDRNYYTKIALNTFSNHFFLNKDYLSRLFKAKYGFSIAEYLMRIRMEKARELLEESNLPIKLIGEHVGFPDNNYFSKAFKNYWGFSPKEIKISEKK